MKILAAFAAFASISASSGHALAQDESAPRVAVTYADLDLTHARGRTVLEERVAQAIDRVCPERPLPNELERMQAYTTCHSRAWNMARRELAEVYGGRQLAQGPLQIAGLRH